METLGVWLRQTREARGDSLEDVEAATRIRVRFLEMLEIGDFSALPGGEVQVRGFLRIYARYLDLSADEVLAHYETEAHGVEAVSPDTSAGTQPVPPAPSTIGTAASQPQSVPVSTFWSRWMSLETFLIAGIVLIVLLAVVTVVAYVMGQNAGGEAAATATVTAPSAAALTPTETVAPTQPALTPTFPVNPEGGVTLALEAAEHVWARVMVDGVTMFEGMLAPGQIETWSGQETIIIDTGNGAGLSVTVNGQLQGTMCGRNEVCARAWGPTGEVAVPAPAPAPTP